ncbi:MAG: tRNA (cytidine(34)-2'-O)-methyltransferase [Syntrophobacteraceae bacterium]|nr:tRNA (cytidine(34)-2'-O)-methyltransferase [Syntrophobacteraceae bacterium]
MRIRGERETGLVTQEDQSGEKVFPLRVVLIEPEIPQNTGNIARTCAATHTPLHLVEPLGFFLTDRHLKRAGLDYWRHVLLKIHPCIESMRRELHRYRWVCFSAHAPRDYCSFGFRAGDCLLFGSETRGLPAEVLQTAGENLLRVPMDRTRVRSLNLSTTVGVALYEAIRQLRSRSLFDFAPLSNRNPHP